jgi:hypothetical protein
VRVEKRNEAVEATAELLGQPRWPTDEHVNQFLPCLTVAVSGRRASNASRRSAGLRG